MARLTVGASWRALIATLLALFAVPASAAETPAWQGVWQGTIGTLPVRVCLDRHDYDASGGGFGAYYYTRHLRLITLEQQGDSKSWAEASDAKAGERWRFDTVTQALLTARWTQGARSLPVRLTRAEAVATDEQPCGSMAFNRPRLTAGRVTTTRASKDGATYWRLAYVPGSQFADSVTLETFALDGRTPAIARVNAVLGRVLPGDPAKSDWFECLAGNLNFNARDGDYQQTVAPEMITPHWLTASHDINYYCGGAHPDGGVNARTFDLDAGTEVDLNDWLAASAVKSERFEGSTDVSRTLTPAFRAFVLARWKPEEAECREPVTEAESWDIGLTRQGLAFTPELAHVVAACAEPILVGFDRLAPWLGPHGRNEVARFRRSLGQGARVDRR